MEVGVPEADAPDTPLIRPRTVAQQGDAAVLGQLLDHHRADLRQIADRLLDARIRGRIDASDLVQQTCLSVHKLIRDFEGRDPAQFVAWVRQVHEHNARNAIREHLHAGKRAAGRDRPLDELDIADADAKSPSQRLTRGEDVVRRPDFERHLGRTFLHRRYLNAARPFVISLTQHAAFAKDIDTRAELEELVALSQCLAR